MEYSAPNLNHVRIYIEYGYRKDAPVNVYAVFVLQNINKLYDMLMKQAGIPDVLPEL
jgi:hypothetical protein